MVRASAAFVALSAALLLASGASGATRGSGAAGTLYTVAFTSSSLPANVDRLVANAGGTIVRQMPKVGGIGVVSANPSFAASMDGIAAVAATQPSVKTSLKPISPDKASARRAGPSG